VRNITVLPETAQAKFCDTLDIDHDRHLLYAGDNWSGGLDVFDIATSDARYVTTVTLRGRIFGVVAASDVGKVFVGLSGSTLAVIDAAHNTLVAQVHTGGKNHVDLVEYVASFKKVYAANRLDGFMVAVDAMSHEIVGRVEGLGAGLEQPRYNPRDGMVYLTDNKDNVLYQIDPATDRLVNTFAIADDCLPNGLAINPSTNQALLACSNKTRTHTVIWDLNRQAIDSVIDESGAGDGAIYEPSLDRFFFAANFFRDGPVIGIFGGNPVRFLGNIATAKGASWVAYDRVNKLVYAQAVENGRPAIISFPLPET
jgi:DNA-binding beta-propeller fold protein YncE